jgi:type II secretory ATPase GspE/PulE/Tfp pilus assembly ATPase PilB-like protein
VAIHEVLKVNSEVRKGIFQKIDLKALKDLAIRNGMTTMRRVAVTDWKKGLTTAEEILAETAPDK